jgi:hypothetical protein
MTKKTIASVGLAAAATAGALLLTGSPASAQTAHASGPAHVRTSVVADHYRGDRWGHRWGHHRYHEHYRWHRHVYVGDDRVVIGHTGVRVG